MIVQTYLYFDGCCAEALEYYRKTLGAEITLLMHYKDSPDPAMCSPGTMDKVMHASFRLGDATLMASDGRCEGKPKFEGFSVSLRAASSDEAERLFAVLGEGGQVLMPLMETFFSPRFGMVADRFGVPWMVLVEQPQ